MNLFTYRLLTFLGMPLVSYAVWKRCHQHKKNYRNNPEIKELPYCFRSRFALNPTPFQKGGIWIHAVSVGETRSIFPLLKALKQNYPDTPITLTNSSIQGAVHAHEFVPVNFQHQMLPLDYPFAVKRFLQQLQPKLVIMVETEIWPNLFQACHDMQIPIVLINARLKEQSWRTYKKWGGQLISKTLNHTQFISAQTETDAQNFKALGVNAGRIKVLGNLKSDLIIDESLPEKSMQWRQQNLATERPVWVAASTHANPEGRQSEEELLIETQKQLLETDPNALLILVPRHVERFAEVADWLDESGLKWQRRSDKTTLERDTQVFLADSLGEMMLWYAIADIAFVGGSLVPFGGHNILEPAALNKPIVSGKHYDNLTNMFTPFIAKDAIQLVDSPQSLSTTLHELFADKSSADELARRAHQCFKQQSGALEATLKAIEPYL